MIKSLTLLFNEMLAKMEIPKQWEEVKVKSVYKNKGKRTEMKNRQGMFLTSVVGKVFEKTILKQVEERIRISSFQNGGRQGISTKDNWLALKAIIDYNKRMRKNTYLIFADAEKCFDKVGGLFIGYQGRWHEREKW